MQNDGTMYLRLFSNEIFYPENVFPFEYEGIELFASETKGRWAVTEKKTGFRISGFGQSQEGVVDSAKTIINRHTPKLTKKCIRDTVKNIKAGLVYDSDAKEWREPIEQVL